MKKSLSNILTIALIGVMAAIVFVITYFRFPLLGSKVHFANAMCLLSGMLLGPLAGGLAAGLGSAIYDLVAGYDALGILITFLSKAAMAVVAGLILHAFLKKGRVHYLYALLASVAGALTYVVLYLFKSWLTLIFAGSDAGSAFLSTMASKAPATLLNAAAAIIAAPLLYLALIPALKRSGIPVFGYETANKKEEG